MPLFDKGGLSNFFSYFMKVSIFGASIELFKTNKNFDLGEYTWGEIEILQFLQAIIRLGWFI